MYVSALFVRYYYYCGTNGILKGFKNSVKLFKVLNCLQLFACQFARALTMNKLPNNWGRYSEIVIKISQVSYVPKIRFDLYFYYIITPVLICNFLKSQ